MNTKVVLGGVLVVMLGVLGIALLQREASLPVTSVISTTTSTSTVSLSTSTSTDSGGYTLAQVATHNTASSCWSAINGNVYDLTSWINQHPGGPEAILSLCGTDGSAAFNAQHGGESRPADELKSLFLGPLVS